MSDSSRQAFSRRLREEMIAQGYDASRSELGADPEALKDAIGVNSVTSARKWLSGESIPRPDKMQAIADWLNVRVPWLRDGEGPKYKQETLAVNEPSGAYSTLPTHYRRLLDNLEHLSAKEQRAILELVNSMAESKMVEAPPEKKANKDKKTA